MTSNKLKKKTIQTDCYIPIGFLEKYDKNYSNSLLESNSTKTRNKNKKKCLVLKRLKISGIGKFIKQEQNK